MDARVQSGAGLANRTVALATLRPVFKALRFAQVRPHDDDAYQIPGRKMNVAISGSP